MLKMADESYRVDAGDAIRTYRMQVHCEGGDKSYEHG